MTAAEVYGLYENGKARRYGLLFIINGGAYALVGFLVGQNANLTQLKWSPLTAWAFIFIPLAMVFYTALMFKDIQGFGIKMKTLAVKAKLGREEIFARGGQCHLMLVCALLCVAWIFAIAAATWAMSTS